MQIKQFHAHFLISIGNYSNERIGFSVELEGDETPEQVAGQLRERATAIVGQPAEELYSVKHSLERTIKELEGKLTNLRQQWDATAEFLKVQGIRVDAPTMPQFTNLLNAAKVEGEVEAVDGELLDSIPF